MEYLWMAGSTRYQNLAPLGMCKWFAGSSFERVPMPQTIKQKKEAAVKEIISRAKDLGLNRPAPSVLTGRGKWMMPIEHDPKGKRQPPPPPPGARKRAASGEKTDVSSMRYDPWGYLASQSPAVLKRAGLDDSTTAAEDRKFAERLKKK